MATALNQAEFREQLPIKPSGAAAARASRASGPGKFANFQGNFRFLGEVRCERDVSHL